MPTTNTLLAFVLLSLGIVVIPGPSNLFILAQGIGRGRRCAMSALIGVETASATRVLLTAGGLSAVLASCAVAFAFVRWTGVAYLAYLGLSALRSRRAGDDRSTTAVGDSVLRSARKGLVVGLANPKMIIFFLALFPQFVHAARGPVAVQMLILGALFWTIGTLWDVGLACASGTVGRWLQRRPKAQHAQSRIECATYLALAGWSAAT
jgi:threonine/homoserine/homoserine lactone efflux protein